MTTQLKKSDLGGLDVSMFDNNDLLNMILQRSAILHDVPRSGALIKQWSAGDAGPLEAVIEEKGSVLAERVLDEIFQEYQQYQPLLKKIGPKKIADIGCGYGVFDVFAAREFGSEIVLIDLETNKRRHFGFRGHGSAYSDLDRAREFAEANGVPAKTIHLVNPKKDDLTAVGNVDLAVSFISCGFHYPVGTYMDFFRDGVTGDGHIVLDLRAGRADEQSQELAALGAVDVLAERDGVKTVHVCKGAA